LLFGQAITRPDGLKGPTVSLQRSLYRSDPLPQRRDVGREMEKHRIMSQVLGSPFNNPLNQVLVLAHSNLLSQGELKVSLV
jgi:hypothetical protein